MKPPAASGRVHFDVGRITLHGYSPGQRTRFVAALRAQLTELAAADRLRWPAGQPRHIGRVEAEPLPPDASPERAARHVAARIMAAATAGGHRDE
jgi:hypothetical protein